MLSCIRRPTITYNLTALAEDSYVAVGRETEAHIQLDSQDIPCLLSRKHANFVLQPGGTFTVVDLGSTNGTFAARQDQPLRKLPPGYAWELHHGDTVGFGGPETIIVKRAQVGNPFLFMYYTHTNHTDQQDVNSAAMAQLAGPELLSQTQPLGDLQPHGPPKGLTAGMHNNPATTTRARRAGVVQFGLEPVIAKDEVMTAANSGKDNSHLQLQPLSCRSPHAGRPCAAATAGKENQHRMAQHACTPRSHTRLAENIHTHLNCPVCCDVLLASHMLHCGHMFCGLCLATWMTQNQSCPSCRKPITGVPVRCFTVDNMINDFLVGQQASPVARTERKRKQEHWDNIQRHIVQDWVTALQRRREQVMQEAARHNQELHALQRPQDGDDIVDAAMQDVAAVPPVPGMQRVPR